MSDLKPTGNQIDLGGKTYKLLFTINAIDEIQDKFDIPISQLSEIMKDERKLYKVLRFLLTTLINEGIADSESGEKPVTEDFIGRKITSGNLSKLQTSIFQTFADGAPENDDPNPQSEQQTK